MDLFGNGTDDILFRNEMTGDIGFYAMSNGAFAGWHDVRPQRCGGCEAGGEARGA